MANKFQLPQIFKTAAYILTKPATIQYPFEKTLLPENLRGQPIFNRNLCISCEICSKNCPSKAIIMVTVNKKNIPSSIWGNAFSAMNAWRTAQKTQ